MDSVLLQHRTQLLEGLGGTMVVLVASFEMVFDQEGMWNRGSMPVVSRGPGIYLGPFPCLQKPTPACYTDHEYLR